MQDNEITSLRARLEQMPTVQLDEILNDELEKEPADAVLVRTIMDILWEREKDLPLENTPKIRAAWKKYRRKVARLERQYRKPRWYQSGLFRVVSAAAMVCLLIFAIPQKAGAESLFEKLARWTDGIVEFFSPETKNDNLTEYRFVTDNPGLQQVYDAVTELGVTAPVVPMWLPEGYELVECKAVTTSEKNGVSAFFSNGEVYAVLKVDFFTTDVMHQYHKDESQASLYESCGIEYTVIRNIDRWVVIWFQDNIECSMAIDCQEDTLYRILDSIYAMED